MSKESIAFTVILVIAILIVIAMIIYMLATGSNQWSGVQTRLPGESDLDWSLRIYRTFNPSIALPSGGVTTNSRLLTGLTKIDEATASVLCQSPCYWYVRQGSGSVEAVKGTLHQCLCNADGSSSARNFP